ncbi:dihydrodipicolinate synthase family protein [Bifidobacterium sp. MA2]|uniref:Dihydrodipicolinate synthase family protein n=1 Tax=Bifidobacterium santillanense TaxID=2809028 RepID=A0ABS5URN1_9BIFI|nr:dihydrodipicolinate synthase family protein [Bifidobacterium santillanense]MBT1173632.1 dihydrodipicolinate synthase family protein [Bifidobacterium santillanense]
MTDTAVFSGIICPSITITKDDGSIDYDNWGRHLDHLIEAGVNGVLVFGSIGEFYAFPLEVKKEAVDFVVKHVAGRIKVFAGVGDTNIDKVVDFAKAAEKSGADALVVVSPYYFGPTAGGAKAYFGTVAGAVDIPVVLYNFPPRTGSDLTPELVAELAAEFPNIVGIKDTVDTISHTRKVIRAVKAVNPRFAVFSGFDEYYLVNRVSGGDGVICGMTNVEPETFAKLHRAYEAGDYATAIEAAERISHLMALYDQSDLFVSAIKGAVKAKGLPISTLIREPAVQLTDEQYDRIVAILEG